MTKNKPNECYKNIYFEYPVLGEPSIDKNIKDWSENLFQLVIKETSEQCLKCREECTKGSDDCCDKYQDYGNWTFDTELDEVVKTKGTVSLKFIMREYAGGAHSSHDLATRIISNDGKTMNRTDTFTRTEGLREFFSDYCYRSMYPILKDTWDETPSWPQEGLAPNEKSFKYALITPQGLTLIFPPYQVASFAQGEQRCDIPLKELAKFGPKPGIWQ